MAWMFDKILNTERGSLCVGPDDYFTVENFQKEA